MPSIHESPGIDPQAVAASLLVTPSALEGLTLDDAVRVVRYMRPKRIAAGTVFIREGDAQHNDYMLLVLEGDVAVESELLRVDESLVVTILGPGHLIGEMGLLDGSPRSATCTASTDVAAAVLSRAAFGNLLASEPALGSRLLLAVSRRMAERLRETTRKLRTFAQMNRALQEELSEISGQLPHNVNAS